MAEKAQSTASTNRQKAAQAPRRALTMLMLKGDPATTLKDLVLPPGAAVAIVSSDPQAMKTVRRNAEARFGAIRKVQDLAVQKIQDVAVQLEPSAGRRGEILDRTAFEPDARSQALLEGIRIAQADLREAGGAYDLDQVRTLLHGISRQAVDKRVQEGSLFAVPGPSNRRSYPTLQFNRDGTVVDGLKAMLAALPTRNPWTILNFLARPDERLNKRKPIDVLKAGEVELVVQAARRFALQGA